MMTKNFTEKQTKILFYVSLALLIFVGILLRFYHLDLRAMHHDESLHALYSKYYFTSPSTLFYKYDPMIHGPLLYHIVPYFYWIFDISNWSARLLPALLGSFFLFVPFLYKNFLGSFLTILLTAILALSPNFLYWSKFLREDYLVLGSMLLMLLSITHLKERLRPYGFLLGLSLHMCAKENSYMTITLLLFYLLFEKIFSKEENYLDSVVLFIRNNWKHVIAAFALATLVYCYYYSSEFRHMEGILDGLYRKSLSYWIFQNGIERISGPFSYPLMIISLYEPWMILALLLLIGFLFKEANRVTKLSLTSTLILGFASFFLVKSSHLSIKIFDFLKLKLPIDLFVAITLLGFGAILTFHYLAKRERHLAFFCYFFFATAFSYSYVGEKVPWLSLYPLATLTLYLFASLAKKIKFNALSITISMVLILFISYKTYLTNFKNLGAETELLSQVHTTKEFQDLAFSLKKELDENPNSSVALLSESSWPTSWYLWGSPNLHFGPSLEVAASMKHILSTGHHPETVATLKNSHEKTLVPFRWWWVPNYHKASFSDFFIYMLTQKPWSATGTMKIEYYLKKETIGSKSP